MDCKRFNTFITRNASFSSHKTETENQLKCRSANASKAKICDQARRPSSISIPKSLYHPSIITYNSQSFCRRAVGNPFHHDIGDPIWQPQSAGKSISNHSSKTILVPSTSVAPLVLILSTLEISEIHRYCYLIAAILTHHRP